MKKVFLLIVTVVTLLSIPITNFAQAPNLGTAANFVLFTSVGAVGNTGSSHLTGNVGTNSGANTGFGNVDGVMHSSDGATFSASNDLLNAYNQLNGISGGFPLASPIGNSDTLVAGVYTVDGNTTLSGTLVLNGQGFSNPVFIFKIEGALSSNASFKIKLINGAQACGIFWKVEGLVTLATSTTMRGTIIAHNAAINISTGATLEGRALSTTGAVNVTGLFAYMPLGCGTPVLTGPAAASLASTSCFALFSGNGEVTNAGISRITGDVGSNVGLTTGYNPLLVNGAIHPIPDGFTVTCAEDLLDVYNYLNTLPADIELLYPAQFGNDLVLTPHVYLMNAATSFTDTLFLNAQGNADAVFVIKINGALSTSTYAKVKLMNGAKPENIFWKVDGAVNINNFSDFKGTIISNNGAISLGFGVSLEGRALTTNGAFNTAQVKVTSTGCNRPLPVSWISFSGKPAQQNVLLEWANTKEMNNGFFTIEKSRDGNTFETLTTVKATGETANVDYHYSFTDQQPYSLGYYRISQTNNLGQKNYYRTIQVKANVTLSLKALHYVRANYVYVQASGATPGVGSIELFSIDGKKMSSQKITLTKESSTYKVEKALRSGIYFLYIESHGEKIYRAKVMVQ